MTTGDEAPRASRSQVRSALWSWIRNTPTGWPPVKWPVTIGAFAGYSSYFWLIGSRRSLCSEGVIAYWWDRAVVAPAWAVSAGLALGALVGSLFASGLGQISLWILSAVFAWITVAVISQTHRSGSTRRWPIATRLLVHRRVWNAFIFGDDPDLESNVLNIGHQLASMADAFPTPPRRTDDTKYPVKMGAFLTLTAGSNVIADAIGAHFIGPYSPYERISDQRFVREPAGRTGAPWWSDLHSLLSAAGKLRETEPSGRSDALTWFVVQNRLHEPGRYRRIIERAIARTSASRISHAPAAQLVRGWDLRGADLTDWDLREVDLGTSLFDETSTLTGVKLRGALVGGVIWEGVRMSDIDWIDLQLGEDWAAAEARRRFASHRTARVIYKKEVAQGDRSAGIGVGPVKRGASLVLGHGPYEAHVLTNWRDISFQWSNESQRLRATLRDAVTANQRLAAELHSRGLNRVGDNFAFIARRHERMLKRVEGNVSSASLDAFLEMLCGYGYRVGRVIMWYLAVVAGFTLLFHYIVPGHLGWLTSLVLSVTSFHGRGFSGVFSSSSTIPLTVGVLAVAESVLGLIVEATFVATFVRRFLAS